MTSVPTKDKQKGWDKNEQTEKEIETSEKRFDLTIVEVSLSSLIVVDLLLTGFDSPILQAMYPVQD